MYDDDNSFGNVELSLRSKRRIAVNIDVIDSFSNWPDDNQKL